MDLGNESIEILDDPPTDRHGDPTGPPVVTRVDGCNWQPRTSSEDNDQRTMVITGYTLWAPVGTVVKATSRIRRPPGPDGALYEVDGEPGDWADLRSQPHHVVLNLRRVRG